MKLEFSQQIFEKVSNIKFNENPYSGSRIVPDGRTKMMKLSLPAILQTRLKMHAVWKEKQRKKTKLTTRSVGREDEN
jgi:hypothetical protein